MTRPADPVTEEHKNVVVLDICSSSRILEDLMRTGNAKRWRDLLLSMKHSLQERATKAHFEIYKFLGDGWLLLFAHDYAVDELFFELRKMCCSFNILYSFMVKRYLEIFPEPIGLTFGLDSGTLIKVEMNGVYEYLGRAINVASRLSLR